jgi:hypothetical protein
LGCDGLLSRDWVGHTESILELCLSIEGGDLDMAYIVLERRTPERAESTVKTVRTDH